MSNLYQDAILDAKALRASAMANAKAALEEAFEPKIQEMMRLKLSEEFDEAVEETEGFMKEDDMEYESASPVDMEENMDINEAELEEILAQLEELSKDEDPNEGHNEALEVSEEDDAYKGLQEAEEAEEETEEEEESEEGEEESEEGDEMIGDETKIIDITLGDLKQVLQSVMAGQEGMDLGMDQDVSDAEAMDAEAESEISLDEILAELENEGMEGDMQNESQPTYKAEVKHSGIEEEGLEEKKAKEDEKELEEARATIDVLRQNLQEVNLLNAKYLYMNKLFKSKSLTESQKVKVINALDRASNVAEVKNTYETLKESFSETKKTQLKESIGFASQAAGMAPKGNIVDADPFINRWQKLAGIPKRK
jgi:hypothetical protein